jgi:hypothetical protein
MQFNDHSKLAGQHAFLSASKYHWVNYDDQKLDAAFTAALAAQRGSALHQLAHDCIKLSVKLPATRKTLNAYVNDALGFRMTPEVVLYYSENAFGTADALGFRNNKLRIHDLKTGITPTSVLQLVVYAALFCLEYGYKPMDIEIELRIYQHDDVQIWGSAADELADRVTHVMSKIITFDQRIREIRQEALG